MRPSRSDAPSLRRDGTTVAVHTRAAPAFSALDRGKTTRRTPRLTAASSFVADAEAAIRRRPGLARDRRSRCADRAPGVHSVMSAGPSVVHVVGRDDLMLGFLNGDELAEFGRLRRSCLSESLRYAVQTRLSTLSGTCTSPPSHARPRLIEDPFDQRRHLACSCRCQRCKWAATAVGAVRMRWAIRRIIVPRVADDRSRRRHQLAVAADHRTAGFPHDRDCRRIADPRVGRRCGADSASRSRRSPDAILAPMQGPGEHPPPSCSNVLSVG